MSIVPEIDASGTVSIRNGVPPSASDPPGGIPRRTDYDQAPHPEPGEGEPQPMPRNGNGEPLENEPPQEPPHREAHEAKRSHHKAHK